MRTQACGPFLVSANGHGFYLEDEIKTHIPEENEEEPMDDEGEDEIKVHDDDDACQDDRIKTAEDAQNVIQNLMG